MVMVTSTPGTSGRMYINIEDTGQGLSEEKLAQLFQPFNRLGQEGGNNQGTGIGLVVTKRLVELMGGSIGVESKAGTGSKFWIELGSVEAPQDIVDQAEHTVVDQSKVDYGATLHTVLYIEDNPANLKLVEQLIARRPDMRLLSAINGNLGIELACSSQPDVILMDINLPGMSGIEALKILR